MLIMAKVVWQNHHIIYKEEKNRRDVIRRIRKGCHRIVTLIRQFNHLTEEEISTIKLEVELKRKFND